ncbi:MAG: hypothetical protein HYY24_03540 [Verrucomicrobia bacterium]|nr:hypothetical protein [Verrucomicrobiota bacterium]
MNGANHRRALGVRGQTRSGSVGAEDGYFDGNPPGHSLGAHEHEQDKFFHLPTCVEI